MIAELRACFLEPTAAVIGAAERLEAALAAHSKGDRIACEKLIREADDPGVREWVRPFLGPASRNPHRKFREIELACPKLPRESRHNSRMPTAALKAEVVARDGFECVFCGMPVIRTEVRQALRKEYPLAVPWGGSIDECHAAFQTLWLQFDHVVPHSRGGDTTLSNVVVTCAACNYGRMQNTLAEMGLLDPRGRLRTKRGWDGLEGFLPEKQRIL